MLPYKRCGFKKNVQFKETKLYTFSLLLIIIKSFGAIKSGVCVEFGSTSATAVKC